MFTYTGYCRGGNKAKFKQELLTYAAAPTIIPALLASAPTGLVLSSAPTL